MLNRSLRLAELLNRSLRLAELVQNEKVLIFGLRKNWVKVCSRHPVYYSNRFLRYDLLKNGN